QQLRFKTIQLSNDKSAILGVDIKNEEAQSDIVENTPQ
ncbi:MAG: sigma-E factor negative regulatory protein RseA, partial [bacterium]